MDREGRPIASIGISGPEADVRAEAQTLVTLLPPAAKQISRMLKVKSR
jgi:DNA-binding IclR family transcriptional regulator